MKTDITNTTPCGLVLVVEGGKGYSLDPGSGVEGATHCTRLHLGRRKGREGNLQNNETQCFFFLAANHHNFLCVCNSCRYFLSCTDETSALWFTYRVQWH